MYVADLLWLTRFCLTWDFGGDFEGIGISGCFGGVYGASKGEIRMGAKMERWEDGASGGDLAI